MERHIRIAVIGDFDRQRPSHIATQEGLQHAADALTLSIEIQWMPTQPSGGGLRNAGTGEL